MAGMTNPSETGQFTGYNSGADMWRDYTVRHGVVAAHCICQRYLRGQSRTTDASEREFCRELRDAMANERGWKHIDVYRHDAGCAEQSGDKAIYTESRQINQLCAGDISQAISFCEYGDGSVDFKTASIALAERYGVERLRFVLACEISADSSLDRYPDDLRQWAREVNIPENHNDFNMRERPENLSGLIAELRGMGALEQKKDALVFSGGKKPSLLGNLDKNKQKVERDKAAKKDKPANQNRGIKEV